MILTLAQREMLLMLPVWERTQPKHPNTIKARRLKTEIQNFAAARQAQILDFNRQRKIERVQRQTGMAHPRQKPVEVD